jgi:hypothetical protein
MIWRGIHSRNHNSHCPGKPEASEFWSYLPNRLCTPEVPNVRRFRSSFDLPGVQLHSPQLLQNLMRRTL